MNKSSPDTISENIYTNNYSQDEFSCSSCAPTSQTNLNIFVSERSTLKNKNLTILRSEELQKFIFLIEDDKIINDFIKSDKCKMYIDRYLAAMVFTYFKRCAFKLEEYNRLNFFLCLYLAHDMVEDKENLKYEILPWALGTSWNEKLNSFLLMRDQIWKRMNYRSMVSLACCEEILNFMQEYPISKRFKPEVHTYIERSYLRAEDDNIPRGPHRTPRYENCRMCSSIIKTNSIVIDSKFDWNDSSALYQELSQFSENSWSFQSQL